MYNSVINRVTNVINQPLIFLAGVRINIRSLSHEPVVSVPHFEDVEQIEGFFPESSDYTIRKTKEEEERNKICLICQEDIKPPDHYRYVGAYYCACPAQRYHQKCIDTWLMVSASCPKCRKYFIQPRKPVFQALKDGAMRQLRSPRPPHRDEPPGAVSNYGSTAGTATRCCHQQLPG
jgi:hypothetical protein